MCTSGGVGGEREGRSVKSVFSKAGLPVERKEDSWGELEMFSNE